MKKFILLSFLVLASLLSTGCTGIAYIKGETLSNASINNLAVREETSVIRKLSFKTFFDGYAEVNVAGLGCIQTKGEHLMIGLSRDGKNYTDVGNTYSLLGEDKSCTVGKEHSFLFREIMPVEGGKEYTYYLIGSKGSAKKISANITIGDMIVKLY